MRTGRLVVAGVLTLAAAPAACGGSSQSEGGTGGTGGIGAEDAGTGATAGSGAAGTGGGAAGAGATSGATRCGSPPPIGAQEATDPPSYSRGTCPTLQPGPNQIESNGTRDFILAVPADLQPGETLPVLFLWHWLGGDALDFFERGEVQAAADAQRFIAVIPDTKDDTLWKWPYAVSDSQARLEEELVFFDDLLACVSQQFTIDKNCVSTGGVSAGALWSAQLASYRSEYLSSFISLSGGVGGLIKPWGAPDHKLPAVVLWGGPTDNCFGLMNFEEGSQTLEDELVANNHFFVECVHNCGHSEPPLQGATGASKYGAIWGFALDHPFWLAPGESVYLNEGLPEGLPDWCGIGKGSATPRTGTCEGGSEC